MAEGSLQDHLERRLEAAAVSYEQLRELLIRLLNYGVLVRDESQTTRELYDRFRRIESIVEESLALYGIELHHERKFEYVRLYPPGSRRPGMDHAEDEAFGGSLRARATDRRYSSLASARALPPAPIKVTGRWKR